MKRTVLHLAFWLVHLIQDSLLHFTWMSPGVKAITEGEQFWMSFQTAIIILPAKLFIAYYFMYYGLDELLNTIKGRLPGIIKSVLLIILSILLFRISYIYIVFPFVLNSTSDVPFLNPRGMTISILEIGYITGLAVTFKLLRLQATSQLREETLVREKTQSELKFLRNQINPHFLFNTLNNIYGLARKRSEKTADIVMKLSELLNYTLYETCKERICIAEELKIINDYILLEKIRYDDRLQITLRCEIDDETQTIAPLLLLPLVENAFKHGVSESRFNSSIFIHAALRHKQFTLVVENSVEPNEKKLHKGNIGLNNTRRYLELLYQESNLTVSDTNNSFKVLLNVNLASYGKV